MNLVREQEDLTGKAVFNAGDIRCVTEPEECAEPV